VTRIFSTAIGAAVLAASYVWAGGCSASEPTPAARAADIVFLGEQHDNPTHHAVQAAWVSALQPKALVFEMLTAEQAERITSDNRTDEYGLEAVLEWNASGWPDFSMYFPIFAAAPEAEIRGAGVPRSQIGDLMQQDLTSVLGVEISARFGMDQPLPRTQQETREALQASAHCDALPPEMLPMMVDVQRLRDAALAQAALDAFSETGGPVVVITGNGHAREDWGAPFMVRLAMPDIAVFSLGQGEEGQAPQGGFDVVVDGPAVDRGDPCDAFK
jgi:uncharacterized iron-regulated protein